MGSVIRSSKHMDRGGLGGCAWGGEPFGFYAGSFLLLGADDFDGDGRVDLLVALEDHTFELRKGLVIRRSQPAGGLAEEVIYDDRLFLRSPVVVRDLNGDGVDDWAFVGGDRASGIGVFIEWDGGCESG